MVVGLRLLLVAAWMLVATPGLAKESSGGAAKSDTTMGPGKGTIRTAAPPDAAWAGEPPNGMFCWPPVPESDAVRAYRAAGMPVYLDVAAVARRVRKHPRTWVVDCTWFGVPGMKGRLFRRDEMDTLEKGGMIGDASKVLMFTGRVAIEAKGEKEMRVAAVKRLAQGPPAAVLAALAATEAAADSIARADSTTTSAPTDTTAR